MLDHAALIDHGVRLARRCDLTIPTYNEDGTPGEKLFMHIASWKCSVFIATVLGAILVIASVRYTLHGVVATLAIVESSQSTTSITDNKTEEKTSLLAPTDIEHAPTSTKPITSNIRGTIKHLTNIGGFTARYRGISALLVYGLCSAFLRNFLSHGLKSLGAAKLITCHGVFAVSAVATSALLARLHLTWTHIIISMPSAEPWYRRMAPRDTWAKIAGPAAMVAVLMQACMFSVASMAWLTGLLSIPDVDGRPDLDAAGGPCAVAIKALGVCAWAVAVFGLCYLPGYMMYVRVQASLLPEEVQTVVPMDRSFGGAVVPAMGELKNMTWLSFTREDKLRVMKTVVKIVMVEVALHAFFGMLVASELVGFLGQDVLRKIAAAHDGAH